MSVIAWDGKVVAADKRASLGGLFRTTTKIFRLRDAIAGYSGSACKGEEALAWFREGADPSKFPSGLRDEDGWGTLLVVWRTGAIWTYERTPWPLHFSDQTFAIGSGRDFALAAMFMGANAVGAVRVACEFDSGCGSGIDSLTFD